MMIRKLIGLATMAGLMAAAALFPEAAEATGPRVWPHQASTPVSPGWHGYHHGQQLQIIVAPPQRLELRDHHHPAYPAPVYGATWVPGFWHWSGYQWVGVPGHWLW